MKRWTIYACTHDGCGYCRDTLSTGVHAVGVEARETHEIAPVEVIPADSPNVLSVEEARDLVAAYLHGTPSALGRVEPLIDRLADFAEDEGEEGRQ